MELIQVVKKRLEAKGWDFASDYWDDDELTSLHEVITETEAALRQPPVIGAVCTCTKIRETPMINGKHICSICNKPIVQTDL